MSIENYRPQYDATGQAQAPESATSNPGVDIPDDISGLRPDAPQNFIERPYDQQLNGGFDSRPQVIAAEEYRRQPTKEEVEKRSRNVLRIAAGITGVALVTAGVVVGKFMSDGRDTAKAIENYGGLPTAGAPVVPGAETGSQKIELRKDMPENQKHAYLLNYAKQHLNQDEVNAFELVAGLDLGQEKILSTDPIERQRIVARYGQVIIDAVGDKVVDDYNVAADANGLPIVDDIIRDRLKNGIREDDPADLWVQYSDLVTAIATSPYLTYADAMKLQAAHATDETLNSTIGQWRQDHPGEMMIKGSINARAGEIFKPTDPQVTRQAPGINFKDGLAMKIVQYQVPKTTGDASIQQQRLRILHFDNPLAGGKTQTMPVIEAQDNKRSVSFFYDVNEFNPPK